MYREQTGDPFLLIIPPVAATVLFSISSPNVLTIVQVLLAMGLLTIPWYSYLTWRRERRRDLPLFAIIAFMHWVYFAQPLFWGDRVLPGRGGVASQEMITKTVAMALLGVICLWLGMRARISPWTPSRLPDLADTARSWPYLRALMIGGALLGLHSSSADALGGGGRQIVTIVVTALPTTVFVFFLRKVLRGEASKLDRILVIGFLLSRVAVGLSSGWLGTIVWPGVICILVYIAEGRPIPMKTAALTLACVMFLQVGKEAFREVYWAGDTEGTIAEKVRFWIDQSISKWSAAISGGNRGESEALAGQTVSRLSLLTQAAHVIDSTPDTVPFQFGKTYSYMAVTLIPRFLWPEKPSMSEANQFYQVRYGLTARGDLDKVSIAVGFLTEGYINFGWFGVAGIAYLVGVVFGIFKRTFLHPESGMLFGCLGVALIPGFLALESQMAQYLSGIVQQVGLVFLILLPVVHRRAGRRFERESAIPRGPTATPPVSEIPDSAFFGESE